jgi:hypothetical protein
MCFELCFFYPLVFQPRYAGGSPDRDRDSPPDNISTSGIQSPPCSSCQYAEYLSRISDLEGRLVLLKHQAKSALDQARKSYSLMRRESSLEDQVSGLVAKVMHLEECDSYLVEIIESTCEQLKCKYLEIPLSFLLSFLF